MFKIGKGHNKILIYRLDPMRLRQTRIFGDTLFALQSAQLTLLDISNLTQIEEISRVEMLGASLGQFLLMRQ
jgi:hypothetical protein